MKEFSRDYLLENCNLDLLEEMAGLGSTTFYLDNGGQFFISNSCYIASDGLQRTIGKHGETPGEAIQNWLKEVMSIEKNDRFIDSHGKRYKVVGHIMKETND